nr:hypothetical protein [Rhodopirellula sp. SM50]
MFDSISVFWSDFGILVYFHLAQYTLERLLWLGNLARKSWILSRIGLDRHGWCELVQKFGKIFKRAAGTADNLAAEATRCGQGWLCAPGNPLQPAG